MCFTGCQCLLLRSLCGSSCLSAIGHNRKRAYPHATAAMYSVMVSALYSHVTSLTSLYTSGFQAGNATPSKGRFTSFFFFFFWFRRPSPFFFCIFVPFYFECLFLLYLGRQTFFVSHANALVYSQCARPCVCECFRFYYCAGVTRFVNISRVALVLDFP